MDRQTEVQALIQEQLARSRGGAPRGPSALREADPPGGVPRPPGGQGALAAQMRRLYGFQETAQVRALVHALLALPGLEPGAG